MYKNRLLIFICFLLVINAGYAQHPLEVEGNGIFNNGSETILDIQNTDDATNALIRFGDNNTLKYSVGYNGNDGAFKISSASTLGSDDFCTSLSGDFAVNSLPSDHRFLINHNSTSGTGGSAHLTLKSPGTSDFSRLQFENLGDDSYFEFAVRATEGSSLLNIFHTDGLNSANIMSFDGDDFSVGVHTQTPEAYLHLRQLGPSIDALAITNASGNDKWGMRVGDEDILIYYNNVLRGGFDVSTGNYNNFPPSAMPKYNLAPSTSAMDQILAVNFVEYPATNQGNQKAAIDPNNLQKINSNLVEVVSGDYLTINQEGLTVLLIQAIQEQQEIIEMNKQKIHALKEKRQNHLEQLKAMEIAIKN